MGAGARMLPTPFYGRKPPSSVGVPSPLALSPAPGPHGGEGERGVSWLLSH